MTLPKIMSITCFSLDSVWFLPLFLFRVGCFPVTFFSYPRVAAKNKMVYEKLEDLGFEPMKQGAEARLWAGTLFGVECVAKERFPKRYRHPALDESLTKDRLRSEARFLSRARAAGVWFLNQLLVSSISFFYFLSFIFLGFITKIRKCWTNVSSFYLLFWNLICSLSSVWSLQF